jgi:ribosome-associated protein
MPQITPTLFLPDEELSVSFVRASGPGGQNVNKVATAVQLRFDVRRSPSLTGEVKTRLERLAGSRMTTDGVLVIEAKRYRTQDQNRQDAGARLVALIARALVRPRPRRPTRPSPSARAARLQQKKVRGGIKRGRQTKSRLDE